MLITGRPNCASAWASPCWTRTRRQPAVAPGAALAGSWLPPQARARALMPAPPRRRASEPVLDAHTLPVGIRATVPDAPASQPVARLWFVHLARVGTGETALTGGALVPKAVPFLGLELGAPLAQGPSGRMWRAVYRKQPVAVKARQLSAAGRCVARAWHGAGLLGWRDHSAGPVGLIGPRGRARAPLPASLVTARQRPARPTACPAQAGLSHSPT